MKFGKFIVFEGINGSGKTTIINKLIELYKKKNQKCLYLKFPNRTSKSGIVINDFLTNKIKFNSLEEQIKIFADNRKEAQDTIYNFLLSGYIIICDRYLYSNLAYTMTDQSLDIYNNKLNKYINIQTILNYDKNIYKPDFVFLIRGNYIHLRNDSISERYHNDELKNNLIFNNYLFAINHTNSKYTIINNEYNNLNNTIISINEIIENIPNLDYKFKYFD